MLNNYFHMHDYREAIVNHNGGSQPSMIIFRKMATSAITRRCVFSAFAQCRNAHTNSNSSGLPKKGTFSSINTALKNNSLTSRRSLQSIAQTKDVKGRRRHAINDAIDVGAKNIASDPCLSSVTLGELREAKYLSQKLQEKIMRWIWEGESWSVFAEFTDYRKISSFQKKINVTTIV